MKHVRFGRGGSVGVAGAVAMGAVAVLGALRAVASARSLEGKVVLVCGASRGLGLALARELVRRGCHVGVCARDPKRLAEAKDELEALAAERAAKRGGTAPHVVAHACDLRDRAQTEALVERVAAALGPIDVLVANAATIEVGPAEVLGVEAFERAMRDIFFTSLHPALAVVPSMKARKAGSLVFIASIGGAFGVPHLAPYSAAKFAEVGLSESLRAELGGDGVHVLTVVPGLMRTGSYAHARFSGDAEKEFVWFAAGATTPVVAMHADRAARRIADAIAAKRSRLVYTLPAQVAVRVHAWAPWLFERVAALGARLLPSAPPPGERAPFPREGVHIEDTSGSKVVAALAARGRPQGVPLGQR